MSLILISTIIVIIIASVKATLSSGLQPTQVPTPTISEAPTPSPTPTDIVYPYESPTGYTGFYEKFETINGQLVYIAIPQRINPLQLPTIVAFYHGSMSPIVNDFSKTWMQQYRKVASAIANSNMIFVASNQHGDNYGSNQAITDTKSALDWVKSNYPTLTGKYNVMGFSMGGYGALKHSFTYTSEVNRLVLISPANGIENYTAAQKKALASQTTAIWHSKNDANINYIYSVQLRDAINALGGAWTLNLTSGEDHYGALLNHLDAVAAFFKE